MVFIIFLTLTTYTSIDLPKIMVQAAGRTSWIPIIIVSLIFAFAAVIITKLNIMYPGKMLFDYGQEIVGKFFTRVIVSYYSLYFLMIGVYLKLKLVGVLQSNFLFLTPKPLTLFIAILLFGYVAYKGITNVARMFEISGMMFLIITLGICVSMLTQGMKENVLPIYNPSDAKQFAGAVKDLVTPFGGTEVLLAIPFTAINKKAPKTVFFTLISIGLFCVLLVESTIMILGINNAACLNDSFIEAIKIVEIPVIERTDILYLTFGLTSLFAGMIIVYIVTVEFACKLFSKIKRLAIVVAVGVILFILSLFALNIKNFNELFGKMATVPVLISGMLVPAILLTVAKVRKRKKLKKGNF